jgi:TonB family protein
VKVIVDDKGMVTEASVTGSDTLQSEFDAAVLSAVRRWRFEPLRRASDGNVEALPFSQSYRFVFRQVNGSAVVEPGTSAAR